MEKLNKEYKGDLIPFSKELWETGEYELANKGWVEIYEVLECGSVIYKTMVHGEGWVPYKTYITHNHPDLLLRKKTKKVWKPIFDYPHFFHTKEQCDNYFNGNDLYKGAIEVEI